MCAKLSTNPILETARDVVSLALCKQANLAGDKCGESGSTSRQTIQQLYQLSKLALERIKPTQEVSRWRAVRKAKFARPRITITRRHPQLHNLVTLSGNYHAEAVQRARTAIF
jgi:hypothetical protein